MPLRSSSSAASRQYQSMQPMQQTHNGLLPNSALQPNAATKAVAGSMQQAPRRGLPSSSVMDAAETAPADAPLPSLTKAFIAEQPSDGAHERVRSESPSIGRTSSIAGKHSDSPRVHAPAVLCVLQLLTANCYLCIASCSYWPLLQEPNPTSAIFARRCWSHPKQKS